MEILKISQIFRFSKIRYFIFLLSKNLSNSVPFDQTLLMGFYAVLILHGVSSGLYLALYTGALALHSGVNIFIQTFVDELQVIFDEIDTECAVKSPKLKLYLLEAFQFHDHTTRQIV